MVTIRRNMWPAKMGIVFNEVASLVGHCPHRYAPARDDGYRSGRHLAFACAGYRGVIIVLTEIVDPS